ncbi:MAG: helix-turn-helix domain-containing protein [Deltaproteobacteria bacterium]|nr:helix-turn-helix domain-containing protein [Deltaproteobacteria bacterium]
MGLSLPPRPSHDAIDAPELNSDHFIESEGYHIYRSRGTTTALLFYTKEGQGFFRSFRGRHETFHISQRTELVLWQPSTPQNYGTMPGSVWDFHWVHFHPKEHWRALLALPPVAGLPHLRALPMPARDGPLLERMFEDIHRDIRMNTPTRRHLALNTLERIFWLAQEQMGSAGSPTLDARVRAALEQIAADPAQAHKVSVLAKSAGLSPSRFAHLFVEQTGASVIETVIATRLAQAERLLSLSSASASEIGFHVGFSSLSLFTRHFKKRYGCSPGAYRMRNRP